MKLRTKPADFCVDEIISLPIGADGEHLVFALKKTGKTTDAALDAVARALGTRRRAWSAAGLKDRHAQTTQHVSIHEKDWSRPQPAVGKTIPAGGVALEFRGRAYEPVARGHIVANEFAIVVRKLTRAQCASLTAAWGGVVAAGMPNYFDSQRFGSCRHGHGLPLVRLLRGEGEEAMRLLLAEVSRKDHHAVKDRAHRAQRAWGDWSAVARCFGEGTPARLAAEHLAAHPGDFVGAFRAHEMRSATAYHVLAFQSMLFNLMLSSAIRGSGVEAFDFELLNHRLAFAKRMPEIFDREMRLPLVRPGLSLAEHWRADYANACEALGIAPETVEASGLPRDVWDRATRTPWIDVTEIDAPQDHKDELHAERRKLILRYRLPAGAYATMALKPLEHALHARGNTEQAL